MKILLLNPPNLEEDQVDAQTIPQGILYLKEFMKNNDYNIDTLNLYFEENWENVITRLKEKDYNIIGIPCYTRQRVSVFELAKVCKEINENSKIVLGGPHATFLDTMILKKYWFIDYIIRGEGEYTFLKLVEHLQKSNEYNLYDIRGLTFRNNNDALIRNLDREPIDNLDILPYPKYSNEDLAWFPRCKSLTFHFQKINRNDYIAPVLASRGCNNNCIFCCNGAYWKNQRYHSAEYVVRQISELNDKFKIKLFDFYDDNLTDSKTDLMEICDLINNNGLDINWWCSSRADKIDKEMLTKMKDAGCFMVSYGIESGSQSILNNIKKHLNLEDAINNSIMTKEVGLFLRCTISIGHPGENNKTIKKTIKLLQKIKPDQLGLFLVKIYPGTLLYEKSKTEGIIDDEYWFKRNNKTVPFYTAEYSQNQLIEFRDMIKKSLRNNILEEYENKVYSLELDLAW